MTSTLLGFDFYCTQPIAFYQHLCNQLLLLNESEANLVISLDNGYLSTNGQYRYRIEAQGSQAKLESLAERIARDFLLSVHLIKAEIIALEQARGIQTISPLHLEFKASSKPSKSIWANKNKWASKSKDSQAQPPIYQQTKLDYCQHCTPKFGDNQSPQFGQLDLACDCCHGEQAYRAQPNALAHIQALAQQLFTQGHVDLKEIGLDIQLSQNLALLSEHASQTGTTQDSRPLRPQVLICNPNTLSQFFKASHEQVITLSCLEKPCLTLSTHHDSLASLPRCDVRFAYNRALIVLTEYLRQKGIDWVYYQTSQALPAMDFINQQWLYRKLPESVTFKAPESLHDHAQHSGYLAEMKHRLVRVSVKASETNTPIKTQQHAICALLAGQLSKQLTNKKDCALLYLSGQYPSQIVTSNRVNHTGRIEKDSPESAFTWPVLPSSGHDILEQIKASIKPSIEGNLLTQHTVLDKYQHAFSKRVQAIKQLQLPAPNDNLHSLITLAATVLGLYPLSEHPSSSQLIRQLNQRAIDSLMVHAKQFHGAHSPRIDFPKQDKMNNPFSFDWTQSIKSLMSFCLAELSNSPQDENEPHEQAIQTTARLAYGFLDSLADDLTSWIEQLDQKVAIQHVLLAGEDLQYSVFTQRLVERLACNFAVITHPQLDLEGANLAVGALYLPQRRR